ncbi:dolichyl-P-Man:Man(7)GlcNAc(2)-PP-dolichol alpha-1,6-mannosyltransferase [Rhizophlyctis rosea]|uniref:Mannosyltransferase n=1 Tax=Rhizophlyctis rosea TaxID=64517 RepID=A0AAD5SCX4_9FUNG|nr:dolichyl-P-Man:Man(7)GlcNAc(2)-PP-dolichol alpha-1,6-mannosyltransferase [Rhizophlyctis rosea]
MSSEVRHRRTEDEDPLLVSPKVSSPKREDQSNPTTAFPLTRTPLLVWDVITASLILLYLGLAPYTKVEESFNLQAAHDLLVHGVRNVSKFDHLEFPGVVPRTFIGPILVWLTALPIKHLVLPFIIPRATLFVYQYIVRGLLGLFIAASLSIPRRSISKVFGKAVATWFSIFTITQFHLLFWASRTLPNIFALIFVNLAFASWIRLSAQTSSKTSNQTLSTILISLLSFSTSVFRAELAPLSFFILLTELHHRTISLRRLLAIGTVSTLLSITLSILIDSYFWQTPYFYPELRVLLFNTVQNGSVAYGVSPWHTYFTRFVPQICGTAFLPALGAMYLDRRIHRFLVPILLFITAYSFLGHKEWRFVVYVVPMVNFAAAVSMEWMMKRWVDGKQANVRFRWLRVRFGLVCLGGIILIGLVGTAFSLLASVYNYPGGEALAAVHISQGVGRGGVLVGGAAIGMTEPKPYVHMDACVAMTGASRFGEIGREFGWRYSKNETHSEVADYAMAEYSHLLTCDPTKFVDSKQWRYVDSVSGYHRIRKPVGGIKGWAARVLDSCRKGKFGISLREGVIGVEMPVWIQLAPKAWILKRNMVPIDN